MPIRTLMKLLALAIAVPATLLLLMVVIVPALMFATAERVHVAPADVPAQVIPVGEPRFALAAAESARLARDMVAKDNLPGVSIAVGVDGQLVWAGGFGWADVAAERPITPETQFRIGAVSKPLTAAGVGLLVAQGKLDLDAPVQRYVPDFPLKSASVSTRQAMAHTAGFSHPHFENGCSPAAQGDGIAEGLSRFADDRLRFEPGTQFAFSSHGWVLVSAVVENAAGLPFDTFMAKQVFAPLDMQATVPDNPGDPENPTAVADLMPERAVLYHPRASADTASGLEFPGFTDFSCMAGAGMYLSTPSDLVRFGIAMDTNQLLDAPTTQLLQAPTSLPSGESTDYALGWDVREVPFGNGETLLISHPGITIGGTVSLRRYPEHAIVVAITSNVTFAELEPLARQVAALFAAARDGAAAARAGQPASQVDAGADPTTGAAS